MKISTLGFIAANAALASANVIVKRVSERDIVPLMAPANDSNIHPLKQWNPKANPAIKDGPYGPSQIRHHGPSPSPSPGWSQSWTSTPDVGSWATSSSSPEYQSWGASQAHGHGHHEHPGHSPSKAWSASATESDSEQSWSSAIPSSKPAGASQWHHKGYTKYHPNNGPSQWHHKGPSSTWQNAPTSSPAETASSSSTWASGTYSNHKGASQYHPHRPTSSPKWRGYTSSDESNDSSSSEGSSNTDMETSAPATGDKPKYWPSGSARARLHKDKSSYALYGRAAAAVCGIESQMQGAELTACPMGNSSGYDCINTASCLESCGGCMSLSQGQDCTTIKGADSVGCVQGKCIIGSCMDGYSLDSDTMACVAN